MVDYGSPGVQEVIAEFGEKILQEFNPSYSWEERKKQLRAEEEAKSIGAQPN